MRHRSVGDLMTPAAVTVRTHTTSEDIARLLDEYDITAVPVVDGDDRPLGVVSGTDLLRRQMYGGGSGGTAADLMTSPAVVAERDWNAVRAARTMERHGIRRLPVVDGAGRLIGVLSRSDLVHLFVRRDHAIQEEIIEDVVVRTLGLPPSALTVEVTEGRVTLSGSIGRRNLVPVLVRLCEDVDGVVDVVDRLEAGQDETAPRAPHTTTAG
ncbi:CBS domain-containing protein [Streptomyces brasiliensis]|uniref:CBS domain-containing protein n=1 Tax=Streptomyces brasiliensis TaxID=1954 RepID=A0A917K2L8_9ACTN|nr:CBS domain-containing protein [Streptomyces brasiliensis]GGI94517.1 hypothetical protein GCM10010121_001110 [Streptomyces brasiliensis]